MIKSNLNKNIRRRIKDGRLSKDLQKYVHTHTHTYKSKLRKQRNNSKF